MISNRDFAQETNNSGKNLFKKEQIPFSVFSHLSLNLECDCADINDVIGFTSQHENWSLNFYGRESEDFRLEIEEFGFQTPNTTGGDHPNWHKCTPTSEQLSFMNQKIQEKLHYLLQEKEEAEQKAFERISEEEKEIRKTLKNKASRMPADNLYFI